MATQNWSKYGFALKELNDGISDFWTLSGSGTNEYYYNQSDLPEWPIKVYQNNSAMAEGTLGSLAVSEYAIGDNDTLGSETLYVRLSDSTDPDTKAAGYIEVPDIFTLITGGVGEKIILLSILASNNGQTSMDMVIYFTNSSDTVYHKFAQTIATTDGPFALIAKMTLNDQDKVKVQLSLPDFSIMISGDKTS